MIEARLHPPARTGSVSRTGKVTPVGPFRPSEYVRKLRSYSGTPQIPLFLPHRERVAKLDWNESVHPPSPVVRRTLSEMAVRGELNWYPDVDAVALRTALECYTGVDMEWIRVFGGSDAALEYVARAFVSPGDTVIWCPPTYDNMRVYVESCGGRMLPLPQKSIWRADARALHEALDADVSLVYLVNPNNPTGALHTPAQIGELAGAHPETGFLIDEAYYEFCEVTCAGLLKDHSNLMIARSFSKAFGLAGLRVGYLMSHPENLNWIDRIRVGKNTSAAAQAAAVAALEDLAHLRRVVEETRASMTALAGRLTAMGLEVRTTPANYLLVKVADPDMATRYLANNLIFVRNRNSEPGLAGWIRITVGPAALVERVASAFAALPPAILYERETRVSALHLERGPETRSPESKESGLPLGAERRGRPVMPVVETGTGGRT